MKTKPETGINSEISSELYNSFLNMLHGFAYCRMIYRNDKPHDFTYLKVNKAFEELTGLINVEGKKVSDVIPGILKSDPKIIELYGKVASTGIPDKFEVYVESLGDWYSVSVQCPKTDYFVAIFDVITEQKRAEENLHYNKANLDIIFNSTDESIALISTDESIIDLNDEGLRRLGKAKSEIIGKKVLDVLPPEASKYRKPFLYRALKNGEKVVFEDKIYGRWMLNHLYPIFDDKGKVLRVVIFSLDITDKKQAIDALTESEIKYRLLFENMVSGFAIHEAITDENNNPLDFRFIEANKYYKDYSGLDNEYIKGKTIRELIPDADTEMIKKYCDVALTGEPFELEYYSKTFNKYFRVNCYSPKKGSFATIFEDITERKTTEEELAKNREQYKLLAENSSDAILMVDSELNVVYVSPSYFSRLGYKENEFYELNKQTIIDNIHPDDRKNVLAEIRYGRELHLPVIRYEYRTKTKSGNYIWLEDILQREYDDVGNFKRTIVNSRIITERKKFENDLKESEEKHRRLFDNMVQGVIYYDSNRKIISVNPAGEKILNISKEYLIGQTYYNPNWKIIHEDGSLMQIQEHPISIAFNQFRKVDNCVVGLLSPESKEYLWLSISALPLFRNSDNKPFQVYTTFDDITSNKKAETALVESEELYRNLFETETDALFIIDKENFNILEVNSAANYLYGYTKEEMLQHKHFELSAEPEETKKATVDLQNRVEHRFHKKKDGTVFPVDISASDIYYKGRKAIISSIRDISMRVEYEQKLESKNDELNRLNAEKDKFFSILAHDLRSPFTGLLGLTQVMVSDINSMSLTDLQKISSGLHQSANNIYGLLTNLLEWAKMQRGITLLKPEKLSVKKITDEVIDLSKETSGMKNIELINNVDGNILIEADKDMLETIIRNLVSNAIKFTNREGFVVISTKKSKDRVEISVKDSGIGMSKDLINDLFRIDKKTGRLGTEKEPSSGLGLLLCKEFAEKHNGKITVISEDGKGSEFIVSFPVSR